MGIKRKIAMLGAFSVGKTSLVQRFVNSIFSDKYHTTVGVKIDKKTLTVDDKDIDLIIWDIHGEDNIQDISPSYLRGASGYLLVVDGTRRDTLFVAHELDQRVRGLLGPAPTVILLNKADLNDRWEIDDDAIGELSTKGWRVLKTSAKSGEGVEEAFLTLARDILST